MNSCFVNTSDKTIKVYFFTRASFAAWLEKKGTELMRQWAKSTAYHAEPGKLSLVPDATGMLSAVWCGLSESRDAFWQAGQLSFGLPEGVYQLCFEGLDPQPDATVQQRFTMAFGLGSYQFSRYRAPARKPACLQIDSNEADSVASIIDSICLVRDLINLPAEDMGPRELTAVTVDIAKKFDAHLNVIRDEDLLMAGFRAIHAVGRASDDPPCLLDLRWGDANHPKLTLVGKGVCFDTGGLDIKTASGMLLMKKDMGGAAHVLGLAQLIMSSNLPVRLRVLIPAVENAVGGGAYRPGDIITMRSGKTVEVGNTDAEGRLVLADALAEAATENPDLLIDIATLTGAARVAVGTEIATFFCDTNAIVDRLTAFGEQESDPLWRLPLYAPYREALTIGTMADLNNITQDGYAGAIIAALFLREFVPASIPWIHFDLMGWNTRARPGRPVGGEAMGIRALFAYLCERFGGMN